ncbi:hypothetical protein AB0C33_17310 [Nonomuraea sp. NPDC048881]|uniref:hypothetical protein n=1 Tax=Nonomuraea sp. NPDC048881 TaxID=3155030 RepID=UPI0033F03CCB
MGAPGSRGCGGRPRAGLAGWWFPAGVLAGIVVWLFGASAWNLVLGIGGPVILLAAFGAVGVSIIRTPARRERAA